VHSSKTNLRRICWLARRRYAGAGRTTVRWRTSDAILAMAYSHHPGVGHNRRAHDLIAPSPWLATAQTRNAIARKVAGKERADDLAWIWLRTKRILPSRHGTQTRGDTPFGGLRFGSVVAQAAQRLAEDRPNALPGGQSRTLLSIALETASRCSCCCSPREPCTCWSVT
jgi:hypothetical protein